MPAHGQLRSLYVTDDATDMDKAYSAVVWTTTADLVKVPTTTIEVTDTRREAQSATDASDVDVSYLGSRSVSFTVGVESLVTGDTDAAKLILLDAYQEGTEIGCFFVFGANAVTDATKATHHGYWCKCRVRECPRSATNDNVISTNYVLVPSDPAKFEDVQPA